MCYERRRAEACVDESSHHALVNAGGREIVWTMGCGQITSRSQSKAAKSKGREC